MSIKLKSKTPSLLPIRNKIIVDTVFGNVVIKQNERNEYYIEQNFVSGNSLFSVYLNALTPFTFSCFNDLLRNIQVQSDLFLERHIANNVATVEIT